MAAAVLTAACAPAAQAPAPKTEPKPAAPATTAPAAPAAQPAAPKPTEAPKPAAAAKPTEAAKPAVASKLPAPLALNTLSGTVKVDGSSTVFPISEAMAEEFQKATGGKVRVTVGISGTGGGFKKFCAGETDISDASRPISKSESDACNAAGIKYVELPVAYDGLSLVVSPKNTFLSSIKVSELKKMWEPAAQGQITKWNQIRPDWPDQPIKLFGAGPDSGTFDYFTDAINGKEKASRGDYTASEDDNVLVQGVSNDPYAIGYFGFAYFDQNKDKLKLVGIDAEKGAGPILPSPETINTGTYTPLSRPLFIYVKQAALDRPEVREFVRFYLNTKHTTALIPQVGYIQFPERIYTSAQQRLEEIKTGSVFPGKSVENVKIDDLFAKEPALP
jgi:phosphate transport system substrate-binding protein